MSLAYIGPVKTDFHGDPKFSWTGQATGYGMRPFAASGLLTWDRSKQLHELIDNPRRKITVAGQQGVLEPIWFTDTLLGEFRGWYLLVGDVLPPDQPHSLNDVVPFQLSALRLPDRAVPVVVRSARARTNAYGVTPKSTVTDPFGLDGSFIRSPGGTHLTRAFDPEPHDSARVTVLPATQHCYLGAVTPTDALELVIPMALEMA